MTGAISSRWQTVRWLCDRLGQIEALSGVRVEPSWPGDKFTASELIWCGEITGELTVPTSMSATSRHERDDTWSVPVRIRTSIAGRNAIQSGDRLAVICDAVEGFLADDVTLGGRVTSAQVGDTYHEILPTSEGPIAFAQLTLTVNARLQ